MASSPAYPPQSRRLSVSHFFRPSVRLKSALYSLTIFIVVLVVLALNAASLASKTSTITPTTTLNTQPTQDTLADSGEGKSAAEGKDAHLVDGGIQRSFEEPDYDLLSGLQPSEIGCDVPLKGEGPEGDEGVLIFLGIFSVADKKDRRDLYREIILPDYPKHLVTIKFILGTPPLPAKPLSSEGVERSKLMGKVNQEMAEHGDMVMLPMFDNIDLGKTHEYFKWVAKHYAGQGRVKGRPRFVVKADDDTILVMPNLISAFKDLDCKTNVYWGTSAGRSHYFGDYFRGLAYAMSWPLVSWIGNAPMPHAHITKIEDARTGQWLRHLDPITDPIKRIDMGWTMGDWNQLDVTTETVGLHWLKWDSWVREQRNRLLSIWENSTQEWAYDQGISPRLSIAKGKIVPKGAKEEHQRQKALGWDVSGNLGTGTEKEI